MGQKQEAAEWSRDSEMQEPEFFPEKSKNNSFIDIKLTILNMCRFCAMCLRAFPSFLLF